MVTIYALINPFNNEPFYIGSTVNPKARLSTHNICNEGTPEKRQLIKYIHNNGKRVILLPLLVCHEKAAGKCEVYIYRLLINHGFTLYNDKSRVDSRQNYTDPNHWINQPLYPNKPFRSIR